MEEPMSPLLSQAISCDNNVEWNIGNIIGNNS